MICRCSYPVFAYLSVVGGFLIQLTLGAVYTYGNMAPYLIRFINSTEYGKDITIGNSVWIFGVCVFGLGATMSFGGFMIPKIGVQPTLIIGCWIMSLGVFVTYWTIQKGLPLVVVSYGLIAGLGVGIAYGTVISIPNEWFPNSKGLVTGIVVAGFGFSPITLDFIQAYFINPNIMEVEIKDTSRVPISFVIMGSAYAVIQFIATLMIRRPTVSKNKRNLDAEELQNTFVLFSNLERPQFKGNVKPQRLFFQTDFWVLWLTFTINSVITVLILSLHKIFGEALVMTDLFLTTSSAAGAFFNGVGRITWGYLIDKISFKKLMSIQCFLMAIFLGTFPICKIIPDDNGKHAMYLIWVVILHFLQSGNFSIFPVTCTERFGSKYSVVNYGILFTAYALGGIITGFTTTTTLEYKRIVPVAPFYVGCGLAVFSGIITQIYERCSV